VVDFDLSPALASGTSVGTAVPIILNGQTVYVVLGDGRTPTNTITDITSNGYSRYKALTVKYDKRLNACACWNRPCCT
jgi:hypothetical protein